MEKNIQSSTFLPAHENAGTTKVVKGSWSSPSLIKYNQACQGFAIKY
jgi:hypothetical protein